MKKLYYLIILTVILGLVLAGCLLSNVGQVPTTGQSGVAYLTKNPDPDPNLVGLWHFDDNALDSSVNSNDGDVHGAIYVAGKFGKALSFDGVDDYVYAPREGMDKTKGTFEVWVKPLDLTIPLKRQAFMVVNTEAAGVAHNYQILYFTDGKLYFKANKHEQQVGVLATTVEFTQDDWHHLAMTWDSSGVKAYVDSILVGSYTTAMTFDNGLAGDLYIGAWYNTTRNAMAIIDEVRIWDGALTGAEIAYNYSLRDIGIDIKPGSDPNSINLGSNGVVPVAILGSDDFNAATVNPSTVTLAGAEVKPKGHSGNYGSLEDVNGDGDLDLVVQVYTNQLDDDLVDGDIFLTAYTYGGLAISGSDEVRIVPPE